MDMNKKVSIILVIIIIVCFIASFIIGLKISNVFENNTEETIEAKENSQQDDTKTSEESLIEKIDQ